MGIRLLRSSERVKWYFLLLYLPLAAQAVNLFLLTTYRISFDVLRDSQPQITQPKHFEHRTFLQTNETQLLGSTPFPSYPVVLARISTSL